jgi:hypothetical protein
MTLSTCPSPKRADLIAARPLCHGALRVQNCWHAGQSVSYCPQVCRDAGCCGRGKDRVSYLNQRSKTTVVPFMVQFQQTTNEITCKRLTQ